MKDIRKIIESAWDNRELLKEESTINTIRKVVDLLDKGQLKDWGTFEELIKVNEQFRDSAKNI